MKVYVLPVPRNLQPGRQPFRYPAHNKDYGVEQDFDEFLKRHPTLCASSPASADWHYLPVYWTRWHLNHDYARTGVDELTRAVAQLVINDKKTFTICQYDDGPIAPLQRTTIFLASRKTCAGIDIPLLCSPHRRPLFKRRKEYLASFIGRIGSHPIREPMAAALSKRADSFVSDGDRGSRFFVRKTLQSYVAVSPRGYGGSSFRFFEAMQLGIVPLLLSDIDTRPFKRFVPWDSLSLFTNEPEALNGILDGADRRKLSAMGEHGRAFYNEHLAYQKWCNFVLKELEQNA